MRDKAEIEAAILEFLQEMEGEPGDAHEMHLRLRQILDGMRAMGMPLPDDLVRLEERMEADFKREKK